MRHFGRAAAMGAAALLALAGGAVADDVGKMVLVPDAGAVRYAAAPPSLPKGVQLAVLAGDPGTPGPFVLRVRIPANVVIAPHTHATAENLTVISGQVFHGMGQTLNKEGGDKLADGGFVFLPANMPHSVWTGGEAAELQVTGTGPFGVSYVNPADDPSRK